MAAGRTATRLRWALVLLGVAAVGLVLLTGYQAGRARDALEDAAADFIRLSGQLTAGETDAARETLDRAQRETDSAVANTRGPGWWLTRRMPGVGRNVVAVRTIADVADRLADEVLPDVVRASGRLTPATLQPHAGQIDLASIEAAAPAIVRADRRLQAQVARLNALEPGELAPQIGEPVRVLKGKFSYAADLSSRVARAVELLPDMLGAEDPRRYLLLVQDNAQVRSTGGVPVPVATVSVADGRIEVSRDDDSDGIGQFDEPPIPLTDDEVSLFGERVGLRPQDVTLTPDFPRSAQFLRAMWNERHADQVDGVISIDAVALSHVLEGSGPVALPGERALTSDNAARMLLHDAEFPPGAPDRHSFLATATRKVVDAVTAGQGDPKAILDGLVEAVEERRVLLWSSVPREQKVLAGTRVGGKLRTTPTEGPWVGVFLNDVLHDQMGYSLEHVVEVASARCHAQRQRLVVTVRMRSVASRGSLRTRLLVYAPVGGRVAGVRLDGESQDLSRRRHDGRALGSITLDLAPGQEHIVTLTMVSGPGQVGDPVLRVTPGARISGVGPVGGSTCSA